MLATINVIVAITIPLEFILVIMYFFNLYRFNISICRDHMELWENEKKNSRAFESVFQKAYRVLKRVNNGEVDGVHLSNSAEKIAIKTRFIMYASLTCFFLLLASVLTLTFIDPMK